MPSRDRFSHGLPSERRHYILGWATDPGLRLDAGSRAPNLVPHGVPLKYPAGGSLQITEGAVRNAILDAGDLVLGPLISIFRLTGAADALDAPVTVRVEVTVLWGTHIPDRVDTLRVSIGAALRRLTELQISGIEVTVADVLPPRRPNPSQTPASGTTADKTAIQAAVDEQLDIYGVQPTLRFKITNWNGKVGV